MARGLLLTGLLVVGVLAGCTGTTEVRTQTVTQTQTVTVAPPMPAETDDQYAARLVNASLAYLGIIQVYLDGALSGYNDDQYGDAAWSAARGENETGMFMAKLNQTRWQASSNETAPFHDRLMSFAAGQQRFFRDVKECAEGHANGTTVPACNAVSDDVRTDDRARQDLNAEATRWDPRWKSS